MEQGIFEFFRQVLVLLIIISLYWPLNIPFAVLAFRMHSRMAASSRAALSAATWKSRTLWVRSALATLGMAGLSGSLMGFDQALTMTGLKPGPVHVAMFLAFVPLAAWWMHTIYGLHNKWAGLSILLLFVFVPGLLLVLLKLIFGVEALHWIDVREWINEIPR